MKLYVHVDANAKIEINLVFFFIYIVKRMSSNSICKMMSAYVESSVRNLLTFDASNQNSFNDKRVVCMLCCM